jgi:RNA polymerase sigma-70 factor (ECF subfamily)
MRVSASATFRIAERESSKPETQPVRQWMDQAAFQRLYEDTAPKLRAYLRRASGNAAQADDILQETFYRFLRADLPELGKFQLKAYLYRTASALLSDHWRREKRERRWSVLALFRSEPADHGEPDGDTMHLFQRLKPQEQALLWLAYVEGFDHREVAAALQLNEKSVRVLLFRARKKLASVLRKRGLDGKETP